MRIVVLDTAADTGGSSGVLRRSDLDTHTAPIVGGDGGIVDAVTTAGRANGTVHAVIVDSPGLDPNLRVGSWRSGREGRSICVA